MKIIFRIFIFLISFFFFSYNVYAEEIEVSSRNVIMYNLTDDLILYEKNPDERVNIASLTKIMTTIISIENIEDYDEKVIVTSKMLKDVKNDFSVAGFKIGDVVSYNDLLYATILKSGADATEILANSVTSSKEEFLNLMNKKANDLNMSNSNFSNVIGIESENHYSSAHDLLILLKYSLENKKFKEIFTSKTYDLNETTKFIGPVSKMNTDEDLNMNYIIGAKTGYTSKAGLCLASYAKNKNTDFILITIGASFDNKKQHFIDSKQIYEYFFNNYDYIRVLSKGDILTKVKSKYGKEYIIKSSKSVDLYLNKSIKKDKLDYVYKGKKLLDKTNKKNDKIGTISVKYGKEILYKDNVLLDENIKFEFFPFVKDNPETLFLPILTIILFILVIRIKK